MNPYAQNSKLAAYQSVSAYRSVANADPHEMVLALMNGAIERMVTVRGCMERRDTVRKAKLLHSCVTLIGELKGSLNLKDGGDLARNLDDLYDYMIRQLLLANVETDANKVTEVLGLLSEIRGAWIAIGPQVRKSEQTPAAAYG